MKLPIVSLVVVRYGLNGTGFTENPEVIGGVQAPCLYSLQVRLIARSCAVEAGLVALDEVSFCALAVVELKVGHRRKRRPPQTTGSR